jgi:hypothetical protein
VINLKTSEVLLGKLRLTVRERNGINLEYTILAQQVGNDISRTIKISNGINIMFEGSTLAKLFDRAALCK